LEVVTAIYHGGLSNVDNLRSLHFESVLTTEVRPEFFIRDFLSLLGDTVLALISVHFFVMPLFLISVHSLVVALFLLFLPFGSWLFAAFWARDRPIFIFVFIVDFALVLFFLGLAWARILPIL
jgi:hypothetical protein